MSTKLQQIAEQAVRHPDGVFTALAHHIDEELLTEAFRRIKKRSAAGVDGVSARKYGQVLAPRLRDLHARLRAKRYRAQPVRRVWLDKPDGGRRPIGVPAIEDKIVQRAVAMVMGAVYEQQFYAHSYGFREGRSAHQALKVLREGCRRLGGGWVVDADIKGFFDNIDHNKLREVIRRCVNDGALIRLIGKWLKAGVMESGGVRTSEVGTPQGGVISPLLANIFLHEVLDEWFVQQVQPRLRGKGFLIRFADDFLVVCEREEDARRVLAVLPKRMGRYGLALHPDKTRLVRFRRPQDGRAGRPETFDFLGFTHYWGKSRRGYWVIKRRTSRQRLHRTKLALRRWCRQNRQNRHVRTALQHEQLCRKVRGHLGYFAIRGNFRALQSVTIFARDTWRYWLSRRSTKSGICGEQRITRWQRLYPLPAPRIIHDV